MHLMDFHRAAMTAAATAIDAAQNSPDVPIPTCPGWTSADLVSHLAMVNTMCANSREGRGPETLPDADELIAGDAFGAWRRTAARFTGAFADESAFGLEMPTPVGPYPGSVVLTQGSIENLIHALDLTTAVDIDLAIDDAVIADAATRVLAEQPLYGQFFDMGFYSASHPVSPDASATDRLLAYLGRK